MSLKDLLPEGTFEQISAQAEQNQLNTQSSNHLTLNNQDDGAVYVDCPTCHKRIKYSTNNPFRPFCSERCKLIDLGAWASDERKIAGDSLFDDVNNIERSERTIP